METTTEKVQRQQHVSELFTESVSVTLTPGDNLLSQKLIQKWNSKLTHNKVTQRWGR